MSGHAYQIVPTRTTYVYYTGTYHGSDGKWGGTGRVVLFRRAIGDEAYWYSP